MRTISICTTCATLASLFVLVAACSPKPPPGQDPSANGGYPPPGQQGAPPGQYPQQYPPPQGAPPGYPPPQQPPPGAPPPGAAPGAAGPMATPGPLAFACKDDVPCGTHHCNTQYGKCAFPCQTANDCINPNQCLAGLCVPLPPQAH